MLHGAEICLVSLFSSHGWLRIRFQKEVGPLSKIQGFPFLYDIKTLLSLA